MVSNCLFAGCLTLVTLVTGECKPKVVSQDRDLQDSDPSSCDRSWQKKNWHSSDQIEYLEQVVCGLHLGIV